MRALLDTQAQADTSALGASWQAWRDARARLDAARSQRETLERERERLAWQIGELDKLAPVPGEWDRLNAEQQRLAHGQACSTVHAPRWLRSPTTNRAPTR